LKKRGNLRKENQKEKGKDHGTGRWEKVKVKKKYL